MSMLPVAFEDFLLSREATLCSHETIDFYPKPFLTLAKGSPPSNRLVREFLSTIAQRGVASSIFHAHVRAVRAFVRIDNPSQPRQPMVESFSKVEKPGFKLTCQRVRSSPSPHRNSERDVTRNG